MSDSIVPSSWCNDHELIGAVRGMSY
jgi:hypothetical protein